jgi:hypothetical protein
MDSKDAKQKLPAFVARESRRSLPPGLIEIESEFVVGARWGRGASPVLRRMAVVGLNPGVLDPSPTQSNVRQPGELSEALEKISKAVGNGGGRYGLLIPDVVVRVSLLNFEALPAKAKELEALIRWKVKDSLGFPAEEAHLSYQVIHQESSRIELLVVAVNQVVLAEYESLLDSFHGRAFLILPATMALLPLLSETETGGQLLTHICSGYVTHAVVEGKRLRFWRSRRLAWPEGDQAAEIVSEAARAAASARDRMGVEITRAWCCARPATGERFNPALSEALGLPVENLPCGANLEQPLSAEERPLFAPFGAPLAGLAANCGKLS